MSYIPRLPMSVRQYLGTIKVPASNLVGIQNNFPLSRNKCHSKIDMASQILRYAFVTAAAVQLHKNSLTCSSKVLQRTLPQYCDGNIFASFHTSASLERARQMTRKRKRKIAVKNKVSKEARLRKDPPPLPYKVQLMLKAKGFGGEPKPVREKDDLPFAADNVYFMEDYAWKRWKLEDAFNELRLSNHPSLGNSKPDGLVVAKVEFDLRMKKQDQYLDPFSKMVPIVHPYDRGVADRTVMAFVPNSEIEEIAKEAGAIRSGGEELISEVAKGRIDIADVDHFVAHEDLLGAVNILAGVLRDKLPREKGKVPWS